MNASLLAPRPSWLRLRTSARVHELAGQAARFAAVGGGATVVQLGIYAFLGESLGAQLANVVSWVIATVVAGVAHHRFTFRLDHSGSERDHLVNLSSSLASLLLLAVNGAVGTGRFALLRWWLLGRAHS